ncbi:hypothetical protein [Terrisporobacter hibernicus]|uniref:Deacetylase PdaC domain-containing protein n=1 Tax=Terrisporobacter hibernicus TaxID=2813371 RepID=A0AAX2ZHW8_9FIRM|nr:hypothetical protein [Terrisporobacter hibernicus]UEL47287.1 hypothetical protein JW646_16890 [Terrisporobacter hibernicus]
MIVISIFMIGCNKTNNKSTDTPSNVSTKTEKNEKSDIEKIREKLSAASNYGESNPIERTMKKSIEYTKKYLPKDIKKVKNSYNSHTGVTKVIYESDNLYYSATYMHPFKEDGNNVDEYDLEKTVGITLWVNDHMPK